MIFKAPNQSYSQGGVLQLRCPACRQRGTFDPWPNVPDVEVASNVLAGQRRCPSPDCRAHVFVVWATATRQIVVSYPAERIDFDTTDVPAEVKGTLEEAISCHAIGAFRASAIMVRRSLEALCDDRQAKGRDLKDRIRDLGSKVVLPKELLDALDDLRLLGNDAAHVESKAYTDVGQAEVEAGIAVTKEVLKAVYQYASLLRQLRSLKKA